MADDSFVVMDRFVIWMQFVLMMVIDDVFESNGSFYTLLTTDIYE